MAASTKEPFVFPRWANYLLPVGILSVLGGALYAPLVFGLVFSADTLNVGYRPDQPVPYSHELHVGQLGLDCKYCHTTVDKAGFAAIPPTQTCATCHSPAGTYAGVRQDSKKLAPVRESFQSGDPIEWVKVHDLPDYAYFNHSAHVNKGVGCVSCHGRVDKMGSEGVHQVENLSMGWCVECHRAPEKHLRPIDQVTNMTWTPPTQAGESVEEAQLRLGLQLKEKYDIHNATYMTACSTCHR